MLDVISNVLKESFLEPNMQELNNGWDSAVYPNIGSDSEKQVRSMLDLFDLEKQARTTFNLYDEEIIFYVCRTCAYLPFCCFQGTVITDVAIYVLPDNGKPDEIVKIDWIQFIFAEYDNDSGLISFYANRDNENGQQEKKKIESIHVSSLVKGERYGHCTRIAKIFTRVAETLKQIENEMLEKFSEYENTNPEEALRSLLYFREQVKVLSGGWYADDKITRLLVNKGDYLQALNILDEDLTIHENDTDAVAWLRFTKGAVYYEKGDYKKARVESLESLRNIEDNSKLEELSSDLLNETDNKYLSIFLERPYQERKLLMPVKQYSTLFTEEISVLRIDNLSNIVFPNGHPRANKLYVAHPCLSNTYIPFENYELTLLEEKLREYCHFAQSLGATEITIDWVNNYSGDGCRQNRQNFSGHAAYGPIEGGGSYSKKTTSKFMESISNSIGLHQAYSPNKAPFLPDNLVWYKNEPTWQRLYTQRMQGGLIEHEEKIETKKMKIVENSELKKISAEMEFLWASANMEMDTAIKESFKEHEDATLSIHIKFAPLENLGQQPSTLPQTTIVSSQKSSYSLTTEEQEYIEELKECLADNGTISSSERRLLEKLRVKSGITEARAAELERSIAQPMLTEDEEDYLAEYKECLADGGTISSSERRLLEKIRIKSGISQERAAEIEKLI